MKNKELLLKKKKPSNDFGGKLEIISFYITNRTKKVIMRKKAEKAQSRLPKEFKSNQVKRNSWRNHLHSSLLTFTKLMELQ